MSDARRDEERGYYRDPEISRLSTDHAESRPETLPVYRWRMPIGTRILSNLFRRGGATFLMTQVAQHTGNS